MVPKKGSAETSDDGSRAVVNSAGERDTNQVTIENGERFAAARRRDAAPRNGPQHVVIDLTNRCNSNCIACWTGSPLLRDRAPAPAWFEQELPGPLVHALLRDLAAMGCEMVRFTGGGEPLMHPEFEDLVRSAAGHGLLCNVTSNGILLRRVSDSALEAVSELTVSLWAATSQTYSRLHPNKTGRDLRQDRCCSGANEAGAEPKERNGRIWCWPMSSAQMNHHELEGMLELACRIGATRVYFTVVDPIPGCTDGLLLNAAEADDLHERASRPSTPRGRIAIDNEEGFLRRLRENDPARGYYDRVAVDEVPCLVGWFFARVMANGEVVPCCRAVMRPMGNLHTASFAQIWRSAPYAEFRRHADESKAHGPYFKDIGCVTSCDNLMHNIEWHRLVEGGA